MDELDTDLSFNPYDHVDEDGEFLKICAILQHCSEKVEFCISEPGDPDYGKAKALPLESAPSTVLLPFHVSYSEDERRFLEAVCEYPEPLDIPQSCPDALFAYTLVLAKWHMLKSVWTKKDKERFPPAPYRDVFTLWFFAERIARINELAGTLRKLKSLTTRSDQNWQIRDDSMEPRPILIHFDEVRIAVRAEWAAAFERGDHSRNPQDFDELLRLYFQEKAWEFENLIRAAEVQDSITFVPKPDIYSLFPAEGTESINERVSNALLALQKKIAQYGKPDYIFSDAQAEAKWEAEYQILVYAEEAIVELGNKVSRAIADVLSVL